MKRNRFIDYLKGVAIFIVVWAHGIQYLNKEHHFSENWVYLIIYSLHMPLFMTISGYVAAFGWKRKEFEAMLRLKFRQLIIPILCWAIPMTFILFYNEFLSREFLPATVLYLRSYIRILPYYLWFLWALFFISCVTYYIASKWNDSILVHLLIYVLLFLVTDKYGFIYIKYMYPYFIGGYYCNLYWEKLLRYKRAVIYACLVIFPLLLFFWSSRDLIYENEMSVYSPDVIHAFVIAVKRYLIGFAGVILLIAGVYNFFYFPTLRFITQLGIFSLGIYILQTFFYAILDIYISPYSVNVYLYTFIYTFLSTILMTLIAIFLTRQISKIPLVGKALFGGRY
jgi:fucose 4-O-acetylase-like acetyltransferase